LGTFAAGTGNAACVCAACPTGSTLSDPATCACAPKPPTTGKDPKEPKDGDKGPKKPPPAHHHHHNQRSLRLTVDGDVIEDGNGEAAADGMVM